MSARAAAATVGTSARTASAGRALRALVSMIVRLPPGSDYAADGPGRWKLGLATWRYKGRADKARASAGNLRARCPLRAFAGELTRAETRSARRARAATRGPDHAERGCAERGCAERGCAERSRAGRYCAGRGRPTEAGPRTSIGFARRATRRR